MIIDIIAGIVIITIAFICKIHDLLKIVIIFNIIFMWLMFHAINVRADEYITDIHIRNEMNYPKNGNDFFSQWIHGQYKNDDWGFGMDYKHIEKFDIYKIEPYLLFDVKKINLLLGYSESSKKDDSIQFGFNKVFNPGKFCIFWEIKNFLMINEGDSYLNNFLIATYPIGNFHLGFTSYQDIYWNYPLKEKSIILGGFVFGYNFDLFTIRTRIARSYSYLKKDFCYSNRFRIDLNFKF